MNLNFITKENRQTEHEDMNMHSPPHWYLPEDETTTCHNFDKKLYKLRILRLVTDTIMIYVNFATVLFCNILITS